jgi:hypothetical protein
MSMPADEPQTPWVDPIVAEVRAARERIVAAVGGDIHLLCEQLRARQAAAGRIPVRHAPRPPRSEIGQAELQGRARSGRDCRSLHLGPPSPPDGRRADGSY